MNFKINTTLKLRKKRRSLEWNSKKFFITKVKLHTILLQKKSDTSTVSLTDHYIVSMIGQLHYLASDVERLVQQRKEYFLVEKNVVCLLLKIQFVKTKLQQWLQLLAELSSNRLLLISYISYLFHKLFLFFNNFSNELLLSTKKANTKNTRKTSAKPQLYFGKIKSFGPKLFFFNFHLKKMKESLTSSFYANDYVANIKKNDIYNIEQYFSNYTNSLFQHCDFNK